MGYTPHACAGPHEVGVSGFLHFQHQLIGHEGESRALQDGQTLITLAGRWRLAILGPPSASQG